MRKSYFFLRLEGGGEEDDVAIGEAVGKVEFVVASEDDIEVETFDGDVGEVAHKAGIGSMVYLFAKLFVFLQDLAAHGCDVAHVTYNYISTFPYINVIHSGQYDDFKVGK